MAAEWWWFLVINAIIAAIAVLSSMARQPLPSPRHGAAVITRRASSAVLQRLRSFSIFSFPSGCFHSTEPSLQPDAAANTPTQVPVLASPAPAPVPASEEEEEPNAMSMDEAYALVVASRQRPESEREGDARRSEEFVQGFKEDLRQQRLNSIFNYTQMLKQRAFGRGAR